MIVQYTEEDVKALAEFLVKWELEYDGATKLMLTAIPEARERIKCEDFRVRPQNSVDGKEHIFTFGK